MAGIGKLFKFGGKKPPEPPRKDYDGRPQSTDGDSEEEGYIDPSSYHPVLPPSSGSLSQGRMPNYPPPRPNHSINTGSKPTNGSTRTQLHSAGDSYKPPVKPRTVRTARSADGKQLKVVDDYSDPWDATGKNQPSNDDYCDPVDITKPPLQAQPKLDDYSDPWDSRQGQIAKPKAQKTGVKDEYIDPWDAKAPRNNTPPKAADSDDESYTYTEPYDAGKVAVLDEQAKRMSLRGMRLPSTGEQGTDQFKKPQTQTEDGRPIDDYESPWESKGLVKPQPSTKAQMPTADSRPSDDYDKPWEYIPRKPQQFGSIPAAQPKPYVPPPLNQTGQQAPKIDSRPVDDYDAPWDYNKRTSQLMSMAQAKLADGSPFPQKPPRSAADNMQADTETIKGFDIDTSKQLEKQDWYHGPLTRVEAECLLKYEEDCSFLIRDSESSRKDFSLSLKNNNAFMHLKISADSEGKYVLGQFSQPFDNVAQVVQYYSQNKLNIRGAEHKYLRNPVFPRHEYFVLEKS